MSAHTGSNTHWMADGTLIMVTLAWGTSFALVKEALCLTTPANFLFVRFALASGLLVPLALFKLRSFRAEYLVSGAVCGFFLFGAFLSQAWGLSLTSASRSGFITGLNVILVPLLSVLVLRVMPSLFALAGAVVALLGLYVLTMLGAAASQPFNLGDALTLLCAFFCAAHILALGHYAPGRDPFWLTIIQLGFVAMAAGGWSVAQGTVDLALPSSVWLAALFLAISCTIFAYWGQSWAQKHTTPTRTAVIFALEPVFAAIFAWYWLGEVIGVSGYIGGAMIIAGIVLAELKPKRWQGNGA